MAGIENGRSESPLWSAERENQSRTQTPYHASNENASDLVGAADTADRVNFPRHPLSAAQKAEASTCPCALYDSDHSPATALVSREAVS